jgi:uncharacterized membrane protein YkgB
MGCPQSPLPIVNIYYMIMTQLQKLFELGSNLQNIVYIYLFWLSCNKFLKYEQEILEKPTKCPIHVSQL